MEFIGVIKNELLNCMPDLQEEYAKEGSYYDNFWKVMEIVKNPEIKEFGLFTKTELLLIRYRTGIMTNEIKNYDEIADIFHISLDDVNRIRQNVFMKLEYIMKNGLTQKVNNEPVKHSKEYDYLYRIELALRKQFLEDYANTMNEENVAKAR